MNTLTTNLPFWCLNPATPGQANNAQLSCVWHMDLGKKADHWDLYAQYTQAQLRQEIQSHWSAWQLYKPTAQYAPWLWAVKVYLWRFPLDTDFAHELRESMGPLWLAHVRHNEDDWAWLAREHKRMPLDALATLLSILPVHPVGRSLVLNIPPLFGGMNVFEHSATDGRAQLFRQPATLLLQTYCATLLAPTAHFYPRWRAFLICMNNSLRVARRKKKDSFPHVQRLLEKASLQLGLTPRTLWKGYDEKWIEFAKNKECTSLEMWDTLVKEFQAPPDWRARLVAGAKMSK